VLRHWERYLAGKGFRGPMWVTEAGYPADPSHQTDPGYRGGASAQARYLTRVIPEMLSAGAARVFITERDSPGGAFASEGVLNTSESRVTFLNR
jgi:hypothetical protein